VCLLLCDHGGLVEIFCRAGYWNGSLVAVKVLEQIAGDFNPRSSLEPLLHHRLSHPNVVAMFDVCTQVGRAHICCHHWCWWRLW
jgi:hypothetical protein